MGCDIHLLVQVQRDGKWEDMPGSPWYRALGYPRPEGIELYMGRNYELFAMLADVRNRFDIAPISAPRGLPEGFYVDLDDEDGWLGDHSFTWLLLSEWDAYDLDGTFMQSALVGKDKVDRVRDFVACYHDFPHFGYPTCQGSSDMSQWERLEWEQVKHGVIDNGWWTFIHRLRRLGPAHEVRLVMGFDS